MDEIAVPSDELVLREQILAGFQSKVTADANRIPAAAFQGILKSFGLSFGHPAVDRIMLQCKIDDDGQVDFQTFAEDTRRRREIKSFTERSDTERDATGPSGFQFGSPSGATRAGTSYEFRTALETMTGSSVPSQIPAELLRLPQAERVRRLARDIHALFTQYDCTRISLDTFRARLREMGIIESPETTRILHQVPVNFAKFYKALQHEEGLSMDSPQPAVAIFRPSPAVGRTGSSAAASVYSSPSSVLSPDGRPSSRFASRPTERSFNPVTGEGKFYSGDELGIDRAAAVGPYNTANASNVLVSGSHVKGREDTRHMNESGAGNIIFNRGENAPGVEYATLDASTQYDRRSKMGRGGLSTDESGVAKLLSPHKLNPDHRFESSTQESQRLGLHGKDDSAHRPATSAGYRSEDHGLLREQVYSAVRQLDSGRISTKVFRERLGALGISVPISVEKLIQVYDCNGRADFGKFIRAFEDFFASHPMLSRPGATEDASSPSGSGIRPSAITREQMLARDDYAGPVRPANPYEASQDRATFAEGNTSGGTFYSTHVDGLQRGHGDILGWSTPATATEAEAPTGRKIPDRRLYDTYSPAFDILSVQDQARWAMSPSGINGFGRSDSEIRDMMPRSNVNENRYKDNGSFTSWMGAAPGTFSDSEITGDMNLVLGRGKARVGELRVSNQSTSSPSTR